MARTWTLVADLTLGGGTINANGLIAVDTVNDVLYTFTTGTTPDVFSWDGATETDISGATFTGGAGSSIKGICWFKAELYVLWFDPTQAANSRQRVFRWDGTGQNWTQVYAHVDGTTSGSLLKMACDDERIVAQVVDSTAARMVASLDGDTWALQTITGLNPDETGEVSLFGIEHYSGYSEILGFSQDLDQVINHSSGNTWVGLGGAAGSTFTIAGYTDNSFWGADGNSTPAYKLSRTSDFIAYTDQSDAINDGSFSQFIASITPDATMYRYGNDNQAWTYNGLTFVEDGTVDASDQIKAFFALGSTLYCICNGNEVYSGGSLGPQELRLLGLAADSTYFYLTAVEGGLLKARQYDIENLQLQNLYAAGAADYGDPDTLTKGIWPVVKPGNDQVLFLRGCDGNDVAVNFSDDGGATFSARDDAGWGVAKFCIALLPDPLLPDDLAACFADNDLYHSQDGAASWSKTGDSPVTLREAARQMTDPAELLLAAQAANSLRFTNNYGASFDDVSDTVGTVNVIEVSR